MTNSGIGKILVVDDEVELQSILVESLASQGYEAVGFTSSEEALVALRDQPFDILLTDLMMPGVDGITLVRESLQIDPNLICIVMTAQGTIQTAVDAMKVGTFDYVLKPFRLQTMLAVLTRAMNTRHLRLENVQLREAIAIHELSETIAFTLDTQTVLSKLADAVVQQTEADEVSVLLPTAEEDQFYVAAVRGEKREHLLGERVPSGESISSWVAREREPVILNGEVDDDRFRALWPRPDIRSSVSIPMLVAQKLVGVLNLNVVNRPRPFTLGQMKALTILAGTAAAALESASLYMQVQKAEENYRSIFEHAIEGIFQSTPEGRFLTVNPAMARILGYDSPEEAIRDVTDITHQIYVHPEDRTEFARREQAGDVLKGFEFEAYRKDGEKIWLSLNRRSVWDENGIELYREGSVEDITERKRAEAEQARLNTEIREERERLNTVVATVPGVVFEAWVRPDTGNTTDFVSEYVGPMTGYNVSEWLSMPGFWLSIVHPDDKERVAREANLHLAEGGNGALEFRWIRKDEQIIWVRAHTIVICDKEGTPVGVRGVVIDVTEHRRAENALSESEERYRDLVENAHDIIFSHDLHGNYSSVNRAAEQITGYTREECLTLNITDTIAPEHLNRAREMMAKQLAGEKVSAYEVDLLARDGKRIAVEVNTKLILQDGVPVGVQGIARDVTKRKQLEEQLRQSQKMEAIGQLAGGVAHDFNNLLTAINGYSSLALQRVEDGHLVKPYLEEVKKAGDRAANLTRQLLAFGRKQILQPVALNLNAVVTDMNKMLRRLIGEDIELTAKLDPDLGKVMADPGQIEQVLVNLIVNARDAMPQGGNLTIETTNVEIDSGYVSGQLGVQAGSYVKLAVSDTGVGMDEETRNRIFEPFFTTKEKGKGTGLGLSTVYGIVKQSGGNIWVYSGAGKGTTFKVYLPRAKSIARVNKEKVEEATPRGGSETVLLVEDEEVVRGLARRILEQAGYSVVEASKADEAIRFCEEHGNEVDLLLTDVVMPEMSGKELADRLKTQRPDLKMLFMSGYTDDAIVHHGVLDSSVEFIQKPFSPADLIEKVRDVLDLSEKDTNHRRPEV